jgi:16S rRNA (guanine966-N2)-methyltransferase
MPVLDGARVLDGFAGSGALGIEALSRGASEAVFIEEDGRATALIERNLAHCGISGGYVMMRAEFRRALRQLPAGRRFDLALLDPPYEQPDLDAVLAAASDRVAAGGLLVLEHASRRPVPARAGPLAAARRVTAGDSAVTFYREAAAPAPRETEEP